MPEEATEKDIRDFYKNIQIVKVHASMRGAFDLEFASKEELIKAIDIGETVLLKQPFYIRSSYFKSREARGPREGRGGSRFRGDRDRDRGGDRRGRYDSDRHGGDHAGGFEDREKFSGYRDRPRGDGYRDKDAPPPRRWEDRDGPQQSHGQAAKDDFKPRASQEESGLARAANGPQTSAGYVGLDRSGVIKSRGTRKSRRRQTRFGHPRGSRGPRPQTRRCARHERSRQSAQQKGRLLR